MTNFEFHVPSKIVYGKGTHKEIGKRLEGKGKKALILYAGEFVKETGLYDDAARSLDENGISHVELGGVTPNPHLSLVLEGSKLCKEENVDMILAIGGGSTIDAAKAIAFGAFYEGDDLWEDHFINRKPIDRALPIAVILTIPASGSENSSNSVITNEKKLLKRGFSDDLLYPALSVINPELFYTLPAEHISYGIADMMSHIFEGYFTNTLNTDLIDGISESVLKTIMRHGLILSKDPADYDSWCQIGFAASLANGGLMRSGRQFDGACHAMGRMMSAEYDIVHGAGLAILTPCWMEYVYKDNIAMFAHFAVNVMGVEGSLRELEKVALEGIMRLRGFFRQMNLPRRLSEFGVAENSLEDIAKKVTFELSEVEKPVGGLKKLYWQDVLSIYKHAY
ncbi:MAG: iron-containing alcohol dehydrogenase [Clostridiales bacterium]|nr:iron-containing alcohol dehydrogenase [Clostridiales bacterium]